MNKPKKTDYKKVLVRNTEKSVPKVLLIDESDKSSSKSENRKSLQKSTPKSEDNSKTSLESDKARFDCPEIHSMLKLSKKIDEIVKPRKTKSAPDVDKRKMLAIDEKVNRKVNFPYDQSIYKDLIPLSNGRTKSQPVFSSRPPLPQKDKEPVLSDFLMPQKKENYYYMPPGKVESEPVIMCTNNLRLYSILQKNNKV